MSQVLPTLVKPKPKPIHEIALRKYVMGYTESDLLAQGLSLSAIRDPVTMKLPPLQIQSSPVTTPSPSPPPTPSVTPPLIRRLSSIKELRG